jgi:hypothetical protein
VLHAAHERSADLVVEDLLLGHEADQPARGLRGKAGEGEVEVADVVDGHHRAAGAGHVLGRR